MNLPVDYYHCFMGNGLDAVLIGYTGSMVPDRVGVDRCYWYKADRYYPEDKLVQVAGRWPMDRPLEHAKESGWYEIAPLGRTWYEVYWQGDPLTVQASVQHFIPQEGTLYSDVDYGPVGVRVTTFLHARRSLLVERYEFDREVEFRAWMGPGVWVEEGWDTDPFRRVRVRENAPEGRYDLGETQGLMAMRLEPNPSEFGAKGLKRWLHARGTTITKYFTITDNRQGPLDTSSLDQAVALGYGALREEHLAFWHEYFSTSNLSIPDEQFQRFYDASLYHFKAMQNRASGGLPVNNLRRTWSSHVFWDSYFIQRALLEANHREEALEACYFLQRTLEHARRHAEQEFGCEGLKWDWEITHGGRKAYGALLHMKDQVHNNASYANQIVQFFDFSQDVGMLREFYPILEGLARFFLCDVVETTPQGYGTRAVVGVHESPIRVKNEGITLAGTIAILRHVDRVARLLGNESEFSRCCAEVATELTETMQKLYNGRYFTSAQDSQALNMSSLAPIYPMQVYAYDDPRSQSTADTFLEYYRNRVAGQGGNQNGFPWSAGVLATILARQEQADLAWSVIEGTRPTICQFGGMTEVMETGEWNMQYFGTAQGAVCSALHNLLLQPRGESIHVFPAVPSSWNACAFDRLLASGCEISARLDRQAGEMSGTLRNLAKFPLSRQLAGGKHTERVSLSSGETYAFHWTI